MALSNILAGDVVSEKTANTDFNNLSDTEKYAKISSAQDEITSIYKNNGRFDYMANNLATPLPVVQTGQDVRQGFCTASMAGVIVVFSSPYNVVPYLLEVRGYKNGSEFAISFFDPITQADTRTVNGFTAFSSEDGVIGEYEASLPL